MGLSRDLYRLQQIDISLRDTREALQKIERRLTENPELARAEATLQSTEQDLTQAKKRQRQAEWVLEDTQQRKESLRTKLYGGTVRNPKELLGLEHELEQAKRRAGTQEDEVLDSMRQVEELEASAQQARQAALRLRQEWDDEKQVLLQNKQEAESTLSRLNAERDKLASAISPDMVRLYEQLRSTRGQAVARVEQGRCQACHIALPTGKWQRARTGQIVHCSSCNRILYVE